MGRVKWRMNEQSSLAAQEQATYRWRAGSNNWIARQGRLKIETTEKLSCLSMPTLPKLESNVVASHFLTSTCHNHTPPVLSTERMVTTTIDH